MFSESQEMAIAHFKGPAIVLAGPGSGKTTVITHRVKNLIQKNKVDPTKILVVTFTKAAAENMRLRFKSLMAGRSLPVSFGTFHSIFFRILRTEKDYRPDSLLSDMEKINIIKEIIIRLKIDVASKNDFTRSIMDDIGKAKGNMENVRDFEPITCDKELFLKVMDEYEREKMLSNKVDFEDMLRLCYELFKEKPHLLEKWQSVFEYVLVDEFQDINKLQFEIVKMISAPENNIFVVGDDDQAIYGFRGSHPELMFEFEEYYKDAEEILLANNYRSTKAIVDMANDLIVHNNARFDKNIVAVGEDGIAPDIRIFKSQKEEIESTGQMIKEYIKQGVKPSEIAVLVRNNIFIQNIRTIFESMDVNTYTKTKSDVLASSMVYKDIICYLKCANSWENGECFDVESFINILNKPTRLISRDSVLECGANLTKLKELYSHDKEVLRNISDLDFHMEMIKKLNPYGAINYIKNVVGYEEYLMRYANDKGQSLKKLKFELDRIQMESENYKTIKEWVSLSEQKQTEKKEIKTEGVNIITMHGSKGLEFKVVFILNVNQGIIPTSRAIREQDFEEERRVFYVAMTRAEKYLHIFLIGENLGFPMEPSMFLNEIIN
ncbi:MAG: ATP-dependent helicase [Eubacterium sp.]|nr:ATP-dependent helicase [Eubacterium sp.]